MSDHGHFSSYEGHKERRTGKICGAFSRMHRITGLNREVSEGKADV